MATELGNNLAQIYTAAYKLWVQEPTMAMLDAQRKWAELMLNTPLLSPLYEHMDTFLMLMQESTLAVGEMQNMMLDIAYHSTDQVRDDTPLLLVGGVGTNVTHLILLQTWYKIVAGFPNTKISKTPTTGDIFSQIEGVKAEVEAYGKPIHVVGISAGGTATLGAALKEEDPTQLFKTLALVDSPLHSQMDPQHFVHVMRIKPLQRNNLLDNPELMEHLRQVLPERVNARSFPVSSRRIFHRNLADRPDVAVTELPVEGHGNLLFNVKAHRIIADTLCPIAP